MTTEKPKLGYSADKYVFSLVAGFQIIGVSGGGGKLNRVQHINAWVKFTTKCTTKEEEGLPFS